MPKTTTRTFRAQRRDLMKVRRELSAARVYASETRQIAGAALKKARIRRARLEATASGRLAEAERRLEIAQDEKEIFRKSMINFNRICRQLTVKNKKMKAYIAKKLSKRSVVAV
jgi:hypothetical protein